MMKRLSSGNANKCVGLERWTKSLAKLKKWNTVLLPVCHMNPPLSTNIRLLLYSISVPPITPLPVLGDAISRLSKSLSDLTVSHASSTASMTSLADERIALEKKRQEMQVLVEKAEKKRSWFSAFREWVETVATFLDEKVSPIL